MRRTTKACAFGAALALSVALASPMALAQSRSECRNLPTDAERIACLEARIDALQEELERTQAPEQEPAAAAPAPGAPPAAPSRQAAAPAPAAPGQAAQTATAAPPERARGRRWLRLPSIPFVGRNRDEDQSETETAIAAAPPPAPAAPAASAASGASASSRDDPADFGAEQVATRNGEFSGGPSRRDDDDQVLHATIIDFEVLHRGRLVVALDNGQMWRQMDVDSRKVRLRDGETYAVEIWQSGFGGYRMKVADNHRVMHVERLK